MGQRKCVLTCWDQLKRDVGSIHFKVQVIVTQNVKIYAGKFNAEALLLLSYVKLLQLVVYYSRIYLETWLV